MGQNSNEGRKVIHLQMDGKDYYFGSLAALCGYFSKEELGISYGSLRNYGITLEKPYSNGRITIKEGVLISAKGSRGVKPQPGRKMKKSAPPEGTPLF